MYVSINTMIASGPEACVYQTVEGGASSHVRAVHERRCECQLPCLHCTLSIWAASPSIGSTNWFTMQWNLEITKLQIHMCNKVLRITNNYSSPQHEIKQKILSYQNLNKMKPLYSSHAHFCSPYGPLLFQGLIVRMGNGGEGFRILYNIFFCGVVTFRCLLIFQSPQVISKWKKNQMESWWSNLNVVLF